MHSLLGRSGHEKLHSQESFIFYLSHLPSSALASCDDQPSSQEVTERLTSLSLWLSQYRALLTKRFHYTRRRIGIFIVQYIFPVATVLLGLGISHSLQITDELPPLELSPNLFFHNSRFNYLFLGGANTPETQSYLDTLYRPCGVGAYAIGNPSFEGRCKPKEAFDCTNLDDYPQDQFRCTCSNCSDRPLFEIIHPPHHPPQCYNGSITGTRLQNVTGASYDPTDPEPMYQTLTTYLLRSKNSFIETRYGGLSFGHSRDEIDPYVDVVNQDSNDSLPFLAAHSAVKVWFSLKGSHALPAYLNTMNNALLRGTVGPEVDPLKYGNN